MDAEEFDVETASSGRISGLCWGPDTGNLALCVHGWLDNAASFKFLSSCLPGIKICAIDLPGHGHSEHRPKGMPYHLLDYVPTVLEVADSFDSSRISIIGHSLGGVIAGLAVVADPGRFDSLILIEALGPLSESMSNAPNRLRESIIAHRLAHDKKRTVYNSLENLISRRSKIGNLSRKSAEILLSRNIRKTDSGFLWRSDPRLNLPSPSYLTEDQVHCYLNAIKIPVQVLLAKNGLLVNRDELQVRLDSILNKEVIWMDGNHHLHMDDPEPVAKAIEEYLCKRNMWI